MNAEQIGWEPARPRLRRALPRFLCGFRCACLAIVCWTAFPLVAAAHSFTAALLVVGENREVRLAEAVRGFLLAADERDGHSDETSDGHLGGVDVHVAPLPSAAAGLVDGLIGAPEDPPDVLVVIETEPQVGSSGNEFAGVRLVILPTALPPDWQADDASDGFVVRYREAYGVAPSKSAAMAYHAARRLDAAIRPLDGVSPRPAFEAALDATQTGFRW